MATFFIGLILLAVPFLLMERFSDKKRGFIYVLFFSLLFQVVLALLIQSLGIFYYWVAIACMFLADAVCVFAYFKIATNKRQYSLSSFKSALNNIDWIVIAVAAVSILSLYQVHYNYTGKISLATDNTFSYHEVKNMVYPYPYFSDEWYAVSLIKGAISGHSLPVKNILDNSFFPNLEIFFHSFIAELMLILGLNPLVQYTLLSIFLNSLIIVLLYLLLRISKVPKLTAGACSLLALYIVSGGNLPGLWQLIPFNVGIIFFLLILCFMEFQDLKTSSPSVILASLFYPPLIPFYVLALLVFLLSGVKIPKERLFKAAPKLLVFLFFTALIFYIIMRFFSPGILNYIFSKIFFISLVAPFIPQIIFYNIIPLPAILLALLGIYYIYKNKKWVLFSELILGTIFWFFYSFTDNRFFAEYERIAILTSVMVVIVSGLGLFQIEEYIKLKFQKKRLAIFKVAEVAFLFIFLILAPFYTRGENWKSVISVDPADGSMTYPKSPVNNYLTPDDLRIFKNIKDKRFLSIPWKGTVIGIATGNYPILTKQGTISIGSQNILNDFLQADCRDKNKLAKKFKLDYIYLYKINCPGFEMIAKSKEGFILYKTSLK